MNIVFCYYAHVSVSKLANQKQTNFNLEKFELIPQFQRYQNDIINNIEVLRIRNIFLELKTMKYCYKFKNQSIYLEIFLFFLLFIYEKNFIQLEKIGQGGFASVYRVVHKIDDTEYAVKQIHLKIKDVKDDLQKHYEKLIREARYLAQVNHPNVIRYFHSWIEVTEKKKQQKQEEQKRQTMELSTSFSTKIKNPSINGQATIANENDGNNIEIINNFPKSPKKDSQNKLVSLQTEKVSIEAVNTKNVKVNGTEEKQNEIENKNNKDKKELSNPQMNNDSQQQKKKYQNQNQSNSDDEANEDSNTFFFENDDNEEIVFEEEKTKSINNSNSSARNNLYNSRGSKGSKGSHKEINEQMVTSNMSVNGNLLNMYNAKSNSNKGFQIKLFNDSNENSKEIQNDLLDLKNNERKYSEFKNMQGKCSEEINQDFDLQLSKKQSEFQLVFDSFEDSESKNKNDIKIQQQNDIIGKQQDYFQKIQNSSDKGQEYIQKSPSNQKSQKQSDQDNKQGMDDKDKIQSIRKNLRSDHQEFDKMDSQQKDSKQKQVNSQQDQEQLMNQQLPISVNNTKSYDRRKNKSMDYQTIGQKQREFQLDKYDEIIFYLQTELCHQTLAEYITNRNKKLFSLQQMIQIQSQKPVLKNNNNSDQTNSNSYQYQHTSDPYDILTLEYKQQAILILKEIIKGLYHIHHICKMVHRDLKPHNIFLTENMKVKIGDFGLVKKLSKLINPNQNVQYNDHKLYGKKNDNSGLKQPSSNNSFSIASTSPSETNSGYHDKLPFYLPKEEITSTCGTATYASPEQLSQKAEFFDHRADIYSLGIIILQLFHPMNTTMELVKTIQNCKKGELPKNFCSRFPRLSEIIKDSLSNDPQKRPLLSKIDQTLQEMEIMESQQYSEILGYLFVTFEQETKPIVKQTQYIEIQIFYT